MPKADSFVRRAGGSNSRPGGALDAVARLLESVLCTVLAGLEQEFRGEHQG